MPALSWTFLTGFPTDGLKSGGIFPAIYGTVLLTFGTTLLAVPLGVGAAVYLAEYAQDNRWTRMIRIAIINLAGIPSVVYGLFGLGAFVLFFQLGVSIAGRSDDAGDHDPAGDDQHFRGSAALRTAVVPRGELSR